MSPDMPLSAAPCPAEFNLAAEVLAAGAARPDKVALAVVGLSGAERWSYARLTRAVLGVAGGLAARGLGPGARILMRIGNDPAFPVVYLGAIAAGMVPVPTSAALTPREVCEAVALVEPALAIFGPGVERQDLPCPSLGPDELAALMVHDPGGFHLGDAERPAYIVFTSGTSAAPRAVVHAHRAILARRMMHAGWEGLGPEDRLLHAGAFNWTYTLGTGLLDPWTCGATALIPAPGVDRAGLALLLRRHGATIFAAAPGVIRQLLDAAPHRLDLPALRHGLSAGEALSAQLRARWRTATGTDLHQAFGMSECSTFISCSPDRPAPAGTLGWPQTGRRVALLDADGQPVAQGQAGEIAVHRSDKGLALGYLGAQAAFEERLRGEWFVTGDIARPGEGGALVYEGRGDDMLNAGGVRVAPAEVEAVIAGFPGIEEVAVAERAVRADVRVIVACYTAPDPIDKDALADWCAERLARYKCPRIFERREHLPRNANGKISRRALRAAPTEAET